ncbi:MAG: molybdopterin-dependent oxidoreductase [Eggerthellaceae bacterium]|nr:molybdopterin-dependent oxidoreductase [Eggerthellaceae bacterium]
MLEQIDTKRDYTLSRRKFIQGAAAATVAAGLSSSALLAGCTPSESADKEGATPSNGSSEERTFVVCHTNCKGQCPTNALVRDGKIIHLEAADVPEGYEDIKRLCSRGLSHIQTLYGTQRLQAPLRRVGERGAGEWEQITWDEAIDEIATKWKGYIEEFGPYSITRGTCGGNTGMVGKQTYSRLWNTFGGAALGANTDNNNFVGMRNALGSGLYWNGNEFRDAYNAKTIIIWGYAVESQPMYWNQLISQKESGVKVIAIEPHFFLGPSAADQWIPIQPGTDGALAMALISVVIEEDLIDVEFLQTKSCAPFLVKPDGSYLRESDFGAELEEGDPDRIMVFDPASQNIVVADECPAPDLRARTTASIDGTSVDVTTTFNLLLKRLDEEGITLAKASQMCDIPEDVIRDLAHTIADSPVTFRVGYGLDHYYNGYYTVFSVMSLAILTGNIGKPGASVGDGLNTYGNFVNYGYQFPLGYGAVSASGFAMGFSYPTVEIDNVLATGQFNGVEIPFKSIYIHDTNYVTCYSEGDKWIERLNNFELIVVADQWMTSTAEIADIVLPVCHWYEMSDLAGFFNASTFATLSDKAVEPLYESKPDYEIAQLLGRALGYEDLFQHSNDEIIEEIIDSDGAKELGVSLAALREKHYIRQIPANADGNYVYGEDGYFGTPTGRVQFYLEDPAPEQEYGQDEVDRELARLPHWMEPNEVGLDNPLREKYPLQYFTENTKYRLHSQWDSVSWLRELDPEPLIKLNPIDADARGIKKGDVVRVHNDRGFAVMKADINAGLRPGVVSATKGWRAEAYIEGNFQNLTTLAYDRFNLNQNFYDAVCEVEKV